jgi:tight adherence protein C
LDNLVNSSGSAPTFLVLLVVAPIMVTGIWLIAAESLLGRESRITRSIREIELLFLWIVLASLLLVSLGLQFWGILRTPILVLAAIVLLYTLTQIQRRKQSAIYEKAKLEAELPIMIQFLTLLISSGISPLRALQIFASRTSSNISRRVQAIVDDVMSGLPISAAIDNFVRSADTSGARRFGNTLIVAIERGSPLTPILSALVRDCRVDSKNAMLRKAGKSEILLMVPVVFLLLPISVLFALFPSISQLR